MLKDGRTNFKPGVGVDQNLVHEVTDDNDDDDNTSISPPETVDHLAKLHTRARMQTTPPPIF
jgi:hypothetical protein